MIEQIKAELKRLGLADNGYCDAITVYDEESGFVRLSDGSADWYGPAQTALDALKSRETLSWEEFWEIF